MKKSPRWFMNCKAGDRRTGGLRPVCHEGKDFFGSVEQAAGTVGQQVRLAAEAPRAGEAGKAGAARRLDVHFRVADIYGLVSRRAELAHGFEDGVGVGFAAHGGTFADGDGNKVGEEFPTTDFF